jgi:hypothetical protein
LTGSLRMLAQPASTSSAAIRAITRYETIVRRFSTTEL